MSKDFEKYTVKVYLNGGKVWLQNGKIHRLDGPAVETADGDKRWYIEGKKYTETEFNNKIKAMNTTTCLDNEEMLKEFDKLVS